MSDNPSLSRATGRPNVLLITTDEERYKLPALEGFSLPARDWLHRRAPRSTTTTSPPRCAARPGQ